MKQGQKKFPRVTTELMLIWRNQRMGRSRFHGFEMKFVCSN
jgi:hypothetical protein